MNPLDKPLPNSLEAEQSVIGAMLLSPKEAGSEILEQLNERHFYHAAHQAIFRESSAILISLHSLDMITLTQRLQDKGQLDHIGGPGYLHDCVSRCPTTANIEHYIEIVLEKHQRRLLIGFGHDLQARAGEENCSIEELQTDISKTLGELSSPKKCDITDMRTAVKSAMQEIEHVISSDRHITGFTTGFTKLDEYTLGLSAPDYWIIAGRPSDGKTALACGIAAGVASKENIPVGIISLEQSTVGLAKRILSSWARVNMRSLKYIGEAGMERLAQHAAELMKLPIYFDDRPALTASQIRATARAMQRKHGCRLFILDYLQLSQSDERNYSRNNEVSSISATIKATAKELQSPFIALSQLNRKPGEKEHGRPTLLNLRDSGSLEQDADLVMFVNRDLKDEELPEAWRGRFEAEELVRITQLYIAKQREGQRDVAVYLGFEPEFTRFHNLELSDLQKNWGNRQ